MLFEPSCVCSCLCFLFVFLLCIPKRVRHMINQSIFRSGSLRSSKVGEYESNNLQNKVMESLFVTVGILAVIGYSQADGMCFQKQYTLDERFATLLTTRSIAFEIVSDVVINQKDYMYWCYSALTPQSLY